MRKGQLAKVAPFFVTFILVLSAAAFSFFIRVCWRD
jgi:hypothetical protein